ncbi:glycosyl transferase, partial [Campylobacter sp. RM12910]|uniref:glycosyl transferase n=1 Tax=Campylobacter molothri TaxID=1032242 RepID=UPI00301BEA79|nr:glycosyl transferase [Campylobacter sp. RM12910]
MNKKNVVLLGGSTCSMINGLQKGLKEGIEKFNQYNYTKLKFYNFSLGASDSSQRIFSIYKNNNIINKAFMVIVSINTNEYDMFGVYNFSIKTLKRNLEILCKILANLNSKIIFIIQPLSIQSNKYKLDIINKLIKNKIYHYNFNYIDMQQYYDEKNVNEFFKTNDPYHQLATIMQILGKNIIENINHFYNNQLKQKYVIPNFIVKSPTELFQIDISLKSKRLKNSLFDETIYKLDNQIKLQFKPEFKNYCIIGIATCNFFELEDYNCFASFTLENKTTKIVKGVKSYYYLFHTLEKEFIIDENSFIFFNENNEALTESSVWIHKDKYVNSIHHCGLSYFLLANFKKLDKKIISTDKKINVSKKYNFTHLIPTVEDYKSIIEEYNQRMDPIKLEPLQNQINTLKTQIFDLTNENIQIKSLIDKKYNLEILNLEQDLIIKKLESKKLAKSLGIKMDIINPKVIF